MATENVYVDRQELQRVRTQLSEQLGIYKSNYHKLKRIMDELLAKGLGGDTGKKVKAKFEEKQDVFMKVSSKLEYYEGVIHNEMSEFDSTLAETTGGVM